MRPLLVTSGEPAGIGPDLCLQLQAFDLPLVILGSHALFEARAKQLGLSCSFLPYTGQTIQPGTLYLWDVPLSVMAVPGQVDVRNSAYVLKMLDLATQACLSGQCRAMITAPVHKGVINESGVVFEGHTEYLARATGTKSVVMLLVCNAMKVALVTTHMPLSEVPGAVTAEKLKQVIHQVHQDLPTYFQIKNPRILVAGLNPHAGEGGHLGREEIDIITPVIAAFQAQGVNIEGPFAADTLFLQQADVFIAMYHDQGLPVLKYAGFGEGVNVTLGLPFVRTSVDHGTALALAGKNQASVSSLKAAIRLADRMSDED